MFVGHGEPARVEDGDVPLSFPDGSPFGPHGVELGVPGEFQYTEWAAAYEEIATALNGIGMSKAQAIVDYRQTYGLFTRSDEIMFVRGIGDATFEKNKGDILVD